MIVGGDAAHLIVDGGHDRDGFLDGVDVGELERDLADGRQALEDLLGAQVIELEQHVVAVRAAAAPFLDLLVHRARHEVTRCQVLQRGRIALHEALAVLVQQDAALAPHALGDEHAGVGHAGGVELPELHVLQRDAGTGAHAQAVAGVDVGVGGRLPDAACAPGGQHRHLGFEDHDLAGFHFQGHHAQHVAFGVADQVQRHPFDEEGGACPDVTLVKRVQQGVAGTVGGRTGARHGLLAQVGRVAPERTLVDGAVGVAVERHAEVLELVDDLGRLAAHEFDGVLVTEVVGALDGVEHVPVPVVLAHVAQRGSDAALCRHRVRTGGEHLGEHGDVVAGLGQLQRAAHAGATGTDDDRVELATRQAVGELVQIVDHVLMLSRG